MNHAQVVAAASDGNASATGLKQNQGKYVQTGTGPAYWGPGDEITFLITGEETGGAVFMADRHRGGSHPPTPATPPCIRVAYTAIRAVTLTLLDQ